jgi:hypothetical protein
MLVICANRDKFISKINNGDIGLLLSHSVFAKLQNLFRKKFHEGELRASHGFYVKYPPRISEANGMCVKGNVDFKKYIEGSAKAWFFRYRYLTIPQLEHMNLYVRSAEETKGRYSIGGIFQYALKYLGLKKNLEDESGVFCTEYTSRIILSAPLQYIKDKEPFEISPSYQLNWMMGNDYWRLVGQYDGKKYWLND